MRFSPQYEAELERLALERGAVVRAKPVRIAQEAAPVAREDQPSKSHKSLENHTNQLERIGPCQSLWIPNWTPGLLNQWDGRHWSKRSKLKKADASIVAVYFAGSGLEPARGPRRVSLMFVLPKGKRMFDRDAPFKSCLDALVHCKALVNDSPKWCVHGSVSYARALLDCQRGTLIMLQDL